MGEWGRVCNDEDIWVLKIPESPIPPIPPVPPVPKVKFHQIKKIKLVAHYLMNFNKGKDESLFIMPAFDSDAAQELLKIAFLEKSRDCTICSHLCNQYK